MGGSAGEGGGGDAYIVKCRTDGQTWHVCFPPPPRRPRRPVPCVSSCSRRRRFPRRAISYPTNPEVLEGSDLSRAPVPDWSASIFPTPRLPHPVANVVVARAVPLTRAAIHLDVDDGGGGSVVPSRLVRYHILLLYFPRTEYLCVCVNFMTK